MTMRSTFIRRFLTVLAVVGSLLLGFSSIRASAAWTAAAAPLSVPPVSVDALQARVADESARSADLLDRLTALTAHADELTAALTAAQTRIAQDAGHAATVAKELAAAKKRLAALERSIKSRGG